MANEKKQSELEEMEAADGIIGEAATVEELASNDELTDEEAESVDGGFSPRGTHSPRVTIATGREIINRKPSIFG